MACGAGAPAMVPEEWECHRSWVRAWPEGGERRTVNGSGHEHRPTGRRKSKKRCAKGGPAPRAVCLALRAQSHRWNYCVERLPSLLTRHAEGCPQLRVAPQGRLITWTASQRPHREDGGDVHAQPDTVQHAAQSYCQVRPLIFCRRRGPQNHAPA